MTIAFRNYTKAAVEGFWSCPILLHLFTLFEMFCLKSSAQASFCLCFVLVTTKLLKLDIFGNIKAFYKPLMKISSSQTAKKFQIWQLYLKTILHACFRSKFDIKKLSTFIAGGISTKEQKIVLLLET